MKRLVVALLLASTLCMTGCGDTKKTEPAASTTEEVDKASSTMKEQMGDNAVLPSDSVKRVMAKQWKVIGTDTVYDLKEDGTIKQIISLKEEKKYGKKMVWKPQIFCVPEMLSRSGKCPPSYFLCDNAKYLMGINIEGTNSDIKDRFLFSDIYLTESI